MSEFFNMDNKLFQGIGKIVDCIWLSVLYMVCAIPFAFTAYLAYQTASLIFWLVSCITAIPLGVATTALYYTVNKVIRHGRGYIWSEFTSSCRSTFKQSAVVTLILSLLAVVLAGDSYIMYHSAKNGDKLGVIYIVFIIFLAFEVAWALYIFPYMARFENKTKQMLKNTAYIAIANLPGTIILLVVFAGMALTAYMFPVIMIVVPAVFMLFANLLLEKVFRKYMSEEDLAAEDERNQEFYS